MKLVYSNGKVLEVRDAGPVLMRFEVADKYPLKFNGYHLLEDDDAREIVAQVLEGARAGDYTRTI